MGIDVDNSDYVYVVDTGNHRVQRFSLDGTYLTQWGNYGSGNGQFNFPRGIVVDNSGNVFVVDTYNNRVQKFTTNGGYLGGWGTAGSGNGQFSLPTGIAIDQNNNLFIVDTGNQRIQEFTSNGIYITQWGSRGSRPGQFGTPYFITSDLNGDIYVADYDYNRVSVFAQNLPAHDPYSGLMQNGSFEANPALSQWTLGGSLPVSRSNHAYQGSYSLLLGQPVPQTEQWEGSAWAHQTIYVDPSWSRPRLTFNYDLFVNDIMDYSDFLVEIQDGVGLNHLATVVRDGFQPCTPGIPPPPGKDLGWRSGSYDLSAYKGQYIRVVFSIRNLWPDSWGIWSYVDNVRVLDAGPFPPVIGPIFNFMPLVSHQKCDVVPGMNNSIITGFRLPPE